MTIPGGSKLDARLTLVEPADKLVSIGDQSGLQGQGGNDSFIRVILPSTGTYSLGIRDSLGQSGGTDYGYKLHIKTEPNR